MMQISCKEGSCGGCASASSTVVHPHARTLSRCALVPVSSASRFPRGTPSSFGGRSICSPSEKWLWTPSPKNRKDGTARRWKRGDCRAALPDDAPFALAIGASILSTLVLPASADREDTKEESLFGPDDVLSGAMQIISFIPLFNWLVWVLVWLDTRQSRYLAFVIVYLAPYLKTGLSLSPEDSWLPLASVLACIVHVQLDISVNGEGAESPLGDLSKLFIEKTQVKDLQGRTDGLVNRLKALAEKTDFHPIETVSMNDDQSDPAWWKAIQEEAQEKEFAAWDEKLSRSVKESVQDIDS